MTTDADLHKSADAHKTNLDTARGVQVDDGQGTSRPARQDPFEARKAMFAKSDAMRNEGRSRAGDEDNSQVDPNADESTRGRETLHLNKGGKAPDSSTTGRAGEGTGTPPSQGANDRVSLTVNGGTIEVARVDIERAGGQEAYLRRRELDAEAIRQQTERAAIEAERDQALAETNRLREELARANTRATGQDGPAGRVDDPSTQQRNAAGNAGVDQDELVNRLTRQIYSGDEGDARQAISEILRLAGARGETLNADQIAARAAAMVREQNPNATETRDPPQPQRKISPMVQATNDSINRMAQSEFADVCGDDVARQATFAQLTKMMKDPANKDRRAVDVARDACEWGRSTFFNPRQGIVEQKRGLPSSVAASGATSQRTDEEGEVLQGSDLIAAMNDRRNFGRRVKP